MTKYYFALESIYKHILLTFSTKENESEGPGRPLPPSPTVRIQSVQHRHGDLVFKFSQQSPQNTVFPLLQQQSRGTSVTVVCVSVTTGGTCVSVNGGGKMCFGDSGPRERTLGHGHGR